MAEHKVAYIGRGEPDTTLIENGLEGLDYELEISVVETQGEIIEACKGADVILNGGVPMPREVIEEIDTAQAIIVGSHGFNHIDHNAATDQGRDDREQRGVLHRGSVEPRHTDADWHAPRS